MVMRHSLGTRLSRGKQTIYRYNGNPSNDEVVFDRKGELPLCWVGEKLKRNGKQWQVSVVRNDLDMVGTGRSVPVHRVFLTDKF